MSDASPPAESRADSRPPRSYLGWGLAATVLCFLPLGLVTLYYGFRTNRAVLDGRLEDASRTLGASPAAVERSGIFNTARVRDVLDAARKEGV